MDGMVTTYVVQHVGECRGATKLQISEDLDDCFNQIRFAGAIPTQQDCCRTAFVEIDVESAEVAVLGDMKAINPHAAASINRASVGESPRRSFSKPRAS